MLRPAMHASPAPAAAATAAATAVAPSFLFLCPAAPSRSLHSVHDEAKDKPFELEMGWICAASNWEWAAVPKDVIAAGEAWAKAEIEKDAMGGDDE